LEGTWDDDQPDDPSFRRASSMIDMMPQSEEEMEAIRNAVISREGLLLSVFDILRRVPRRVLMVLKLNDLTRYGAHSCVVIVTIVILIYICTRARSLDHALMTTHSNVSYFIFYYHTF
jgi:aarF domain-containing kinase